MYIILQVFERPVNQFGATILTNAGHREFIKKRVLERVKKTEEKKEKEEEDKLRKEIEAHEKFVKKQELSLIRLRKKNSDLIAAQNVYDLWIDCQILIEGENGQSIYPEQNWKKLKANDIKAAYNFFVVPKLPKNQLKLTKKNDQVTILNEIFLTRPDNVELEDVQVETIDENDNIITTLHTDELEAEI